MVDAVESFFSRFATEGSLLNLALLVFCGILYRLYSQSQKSREEDRKLEQAARKADADSQAAALTRMSDALVGVKSLLDVLNYQMGRDK